MVEYEKKLVMRQVKESIDDASILLNCKTCQCCVLTFLTSEFDEVFDAYKDYIRIRKESRGISRSENVVEGHCCCTC